jgi:D-alanine-D-alanine ligase
MVSAPHPASPSASGGPREAVVLHSDQQASTAAAADVVAALAGAGLATHARCVSSADLLAAVEELACRAAEVAVVNLAAGLDSERRHASLVAALLAFRRLRFAGNSSETLACALDKRITKAILYAAGIPTPGARVFRAVPARDTVRDMAFPLVVKPLRPDPKLGRLPLNSFVRTPDELCRRVEEVLDAFEQPALAEIYMEGREFAVAVGGQGRGAGVVSVAEVVFDDAGEAPRLAIDGVPVVRRCPAEVGEHVRVGLATAALAAYRALECRDFAWIGTRLDGRGNPQVFEVDAAPDLAGDGLFARAISVSGDSYPDFLLRTVGNAWSR